MTTLRRRVLPSFALIAGLLGFILSAHAEQTLPVRVQITKVYKTTKGKKPARVVDPSKLKVKVSLEKASGPLQIESVELPAGVSFQTPVGFPIKLRFPTRGKKLKKGTFSSVTWTLRAQGELAGTALLQVKKADPAGSSTDTLQVTLPQGGVATLQVPAAAPEAPLSPPVTTAPPPTPVTEPPPPPITSTTPTAEPPSTAQPAAPAVTTAPVTDPAAAARQARYDNFRKFLHISPFLYAGPGVLLPAENLGASFFPSSQFSPLYRPVGVGWVGAGAEIDLSIPVHAKHHMVGKFSGGANWMPQQNLQTVGGQFGAGLGYCGFKERAVCVLAKFAGVFGRMLGDLSNIADKSAVRAVVPSIQIEAQITKNLYLGIEPSLFLRQDSDLTSFVGISLPVTIRWDWSFVDVD